MNWNELFDQVICDAIKNTNEEMHQEYEDFKRLVDDTIQDPEVLERFLAATNRIASIRNRPFYKTEIDCLKKHWAELKERLKNLVGQHEDADYQAFKKSVLAFLKPNETNNSPSKDSNSTPHAAILRLAASVLPGYLTSIAAEGNMNELMRYLKNNNLLEDNNWNDKTDFAKSHFLSDTIKTKYHDYLVTKNSPTQNIIRQFYCVPWSLLEFFRGEDVREIEFLVRDHKNLILTGAPGTGKTYLAKKVASLIITGDSDFENLNDSDRKKFDEHYKFVQFHPSYDYSDFVEGLRPDEKNSQGFIRKNGVFKAFCDNAYKSYKERKEDKYVFIIDEINRGEISKIFGELFFSIDPDYRGEKGRVDTQYQNLVPKGDIFENGFFVPENVYVIGTMNDIDRSVESMDFAFRRRFAFHEITADSTAKQILRNVDDSDTLCKKMKNLNQAITDANIGALSEAYQIGASYFKKIESITDKDKYGSLFDTFIKGVLYEYFRGLPEEDVKKKMKKLEEAYKK